MRKFQIALLLIIATVIFAAANNAFAQKPVKDESLRQEKQEPLLTRTSFRRCHDKKAYQVAKEIPWVLDSIYCYCFLQGISGIQTQEPFELFC